jgi:hypothetical protein
MHIQYIISPAMVISVFNIIHIIGIKQAITVIISNIQLMSIIPSWVDEVRKTGSTGTRSCRYRAYASDQPAAQTAFQSSGKK